MAQDTVKKIIASRLGPEAASEQTEEDKFYSILVGEAVTEHFLELRFRIGMRSCFSYDDLLWFNYDPDAGMIDIEVGGFLITIKGRGLGDRLFQGLKQKRVGWVQEADTDMQDHPGNSLFISEITITAPSTGDDEKAAEK